MTPSSLSLRPQNGETPLHLICMNTESNEASLEMVRKVHNIWKDAAMEPDNVRRARSVPLILRPSDVTSFSHLRRMATHHCTV